MSRPGEEDHDCAYREREDRECAARAVVDALRDLYDEDHLQCERVNADEPCDVCVPCVARLKYQQAWDLVGEQMKVPCP
jgi:hypothetical protein